MYKLEFTLKQHTPLIHFQHDQEGATLRATEVKPKLDFFIMKKQLNDPLIPDNEIRNRFREIAIKKQTDGSDHKWKNWLIGDGDHAALDYRMRIEGQLVKKIVFSPMPLNNGKKNSISSNPSAIQLFGNNLEILDNCSYFADSEFIKFLPQTDIIDPERTLWEKLRPGVMLENVKLYICTFNDDIKDNCENVVPHFFATSNFGTRQSKGFGSFTTEDFDMRIHFNHSNCIYHKACSGGYTAQLQTIAEDWKHLKAGTNPPGPTYYKSDLMKYFCILDGTRWEKRKIKKAIHTNYPVLYNALRRNGLVNRIQGCRRDTIDPNEIPINESYKYIRAVLGLAEQNEYSKPGPPAKVRISDRSDNAVERFKSPITFKVINNSIYLICNPIPPELSDSGKRLFSFDLSANHDRIPYLGNLATLTVPSNFNICDFLDSAWIENDFSNVANWGKTDALTVAQHHRYIKLQQIIP